jgi:thioredoxin-like negative regulator of GroEL
MKGHMSLKIKSQLLASAMIISAIMGPMAVGEASAENGAATRALQCGKACMKKGDYKSAAKDFESAVKLEPKTCESHFLLGQTYCKLKNYAQAKKELRAAIRVGKGSAFAQKANVALMALPKQFQSPRTGPETRMIASMLGLTRDRGGSSRPTVIDFYAPWCQPCKQLDAALEKAKTQYGDKINFMHVDVDDPNNEKLLDQYEVSPIPTMVFLNPEGEVVTFSIGFSGDSSVNDGIKKILTQG